MANRKMKLQVSWQWLLIQRNRVKLGLGVPVEHTWVPHSVQGNLGVIRCTCNFSETYFQNATPFTVILFLT